MYCVRYPSHCTNALLHARRSVCAYDSLILTARTDTERGIAGFRWLWKCKFSRIKCQKFPHWGPGAMPWQGSGMVSRNKLQIDLECL